MFSMIGGLSDSLISLALVGLFLLAIGFVGWCLYKFTKEVEAVGPDKARKFPVVFKEEFVKWKRLVW